MDHLFLDSIAVHPDAHGEGVGRYRLLAFVDAHARALGLSEVRLYTNAMMWENQYTDPKYGYEVVERRWHGRYDRSTTASGSTDGFRAGARRASGRGLSAGARGPGRSPVRPPRAVDVPRTSGARRARLVGLVPHSAGLRLPQGLLHGHTAHGCLLVPTGVRGCTEVDPFRESCSSVGICLWRLSRFDCQWWVSPWGT